GALEGDAKDLPPPIKWESKEWELGPPDYFFQPAAAFTVPPTKPDQDLYQCIVIPTNLQEDIWVDGFEYKVDNRKIVHHIVGFASVNGKAEQMDASTPEPGFPCGMGGANSVMLAASLDSMLGGWGPGVPANLNHPGTAKPLPKGSSILLQMHYYNQTGKEQLDRSGLAVHVAKGTVRARSRVMAVIAPPSSFFIKAGDANAGNRGQWAVPQDIMIYSLAAHMHNLGKAMKMTALYPDGASEILLDVPRYDFNWQRTYRLTEPKAIPKGTKILMESLHDNSASNPKNIHNPPVDIKWGESTTEEMSIGFVGYWNAAENLNIPPHGAPAKPGAAGGF
ncbi:hypothetical protein HY256_08445, partial [Candidatus Sumerlaeota bacterium]|nr:hypothetical protein [Candidatus Sumerlaeota bacterium]